MAQCPICGKESMEKEITVDGKRVVNLCNTCHSFIICLVKPVSHYSRTNAQNWAEEKIKNHESPYIRDFLNLCYNYSLSENNEADIPSSSGAENSSGDPSVSYTAPEQVFSVASPAKKVSIKNTRMVKTLCYLSIILMGIVGAVIGAPIDETFLFVGLVVGLLVGALLSAFTMMFVEMSENIAINARASLHTEQILEEIRLSMKNSQK